ncbi:hypothetical protein ACN47E_000272 [Coniothyrium glycines]
MPVYDYMNPLNEWIEWFAGRKPVSKKDGALRFGILGAANIALTAIVIPARSHPEVIVAALAARDRKKAEAYAEKYGIPIVHDNYDDLINDPSIDCIYNPLPNGLHYEWTLKALKAGKHVLLEKPSVSNTEEALSLFNHPVLQSPKAPIILEASHYRFHPAWPAFLSLFDKNQVEEAEAAAAIPGGSFPYTDIRFNYDLAGGSLLDLGHYPLSAIRGVFGTEPTSVISATPRLVPEGFDVRCDERMVATYKFPNGGVGKMSGDLGARGGYWFPWLTSRWPSLRDLPPWISVKLREQKLEEADGSSRTVQKTVRLTNFMGPHAGHKITSTISTVWRDAAGAETKHESHTDINKVYTWPEGSDVPVKGEEWWSTYRYMLEEFVNKVKDRKGSGSWVDGAESIKQAQATDLTYEKAGLLLRPTSTSLEH